MQEEVVEQLSEGGASETGTECGRWLGLVFAAFRGGEGVVGGGGRGCEWWVWGLAGRDRALLHLPHSFDPASHRCRSPPRLPSLPPSHTLHAHSTSPHLYCM